MREWVIPWKRHLLVARCSGLQHTASKVGGIIDEMVHYIAALGG